MAVANNEAQQSTAARQPSGGADDKANAGNGKA